MNSIPVIGVPIVNGFHWLQRLVDSVDYPVDNFVIFNNNGRGELVEELDNLAKQPHPFIKKMTVCHLPSNIGVAGVFNLIIKSYVMAPYWIIANNDIAFVPGLLEEMVEVSKDTEVGMVHPNAGDYGIGSFDLFLIKDWVIQDYGLFDENLYPAYCEDADYVMRIFHAPFKKISSLSKIHYHGDGLANEYYVHGGQTKKISPELDKRLSEINEINFTYLTSKWGEGWRMVNPWKHPTNRVGVPISYTTYDLKFVRSKHLGF